VATLLVTAKNIARPVRFSRLAYYGEAAGQSFKLGALVGIAAGVVSAGVSDPAAGTIVGLAAENATGVTGNQVGVWVADQNTEFIANVQDTGALAAADVGALYGVVVDAAKGNILRVDKSDTTNTRVVVTRLVDAVGDVNGRVEFRFLSAARGPFA
jgi:hypothetical protein